MAFSILRSAGYNLDCSYTSSIVVAILNAFVAGAPLSELIYDFNNKRLYHLVHVAHASTNAVNYTLSLGISSRKTFWLGNCTRKYNSCIVTCIVMQYFWILLLYLLKFLGVPKNHQLLKNCRIRNINLSLGIDPMLTYLITCF